MLSPRTLTASDGVRVDDVACRHERGRGSDELYDHPHGHGDDCTALFLTPERAAELWGGDPELPREPLRTPGRLEVEHRALLAAGRRGADPHAVFERAIALAARVLAAADPLRVDSGRPATAQARRRLVAAAREALVEDVDRPLPDLARTLSVSPHHLSRVFRSITGHTIARHRMRLRTRQALERLAGGECDLARLAAETGFADHSHLCRVLRSETAASPSALRALLAPPPA